MPPKKKVLEGLQSEHHRAVVRFRPADWTPDLIASNLSAEPYTLHYFAIRGCARAASATTAARHVASACARVRKRDARRGSEPGTCRCTTSLDTHD